MKHSPKKPADLSEQVAEEQLAKVDAESRRLDKEAETAIEIAIEVSPEVAQDPRILELMAAVKRDKSDLNSPSGGRRTTARLKTMKAEMERVRMDISRVTAEKEGTEVLHPKEYHPHHEHPHLSPEEAKVFHKKAHRAHEVHEELEKLIGHDPLSQEEGDFQQPIL